MKKYFKVLFYILLLILLGCSIPNEKNINVLVVTGGKKMDTLAVKTMFDQFNHISYATKSQPEANNIYLSSAIDSIDVIVYYDVVQEINEEQKEKFLKVLSKGKGLVFLHHALVSYQKWSEYEKIIGGKYYKILDDGDSLKVTPSTYKHDVKIPIHIVDNNHPITRGIKDFTILDEVYKKYSVSADVNPILTTNHPDNEKIMGWTHMYKKSRIVYLQLGDRGETFSNPVFRKLVSRSIEWTATNDVSILE
ncbi:ThuA domain-containing protein [Mangrovivirga cuniculi]|uniref:ThuA domain-containing protein n=1 Tax=Mangrovivirga cuniculi TaxID=2715131 RepID=A0A4D7JYH3_9BACT|nr:ThuA domain-containing protein [Mangrovivirga cuniculi]QCK15745.1 ThuA domain-containing protein [Mangrovivirga cuniculi]